MVLNFDDFVRDTEGSILRVLDFVGANAAQFEYRKLPPGMKVWTDESVNLCQANG